MGSCTDCYSGISGEEEGAHDSGAPPPVAHTPTFPPPSETSVRGACLVSLSPSLPPFRVPRILCVRQVQGLRAPRPLFAPVAAADLRTLGAPSPSTAVPAEGRGLPEGAAGRALSLR